MQSFQEKVGTCAFSRALSGFQSTFMFSNRFHISLRFIPFHGAFILFHGALFFLHSTFFSCIALLFKYSKCESALFIFSLQNIMQLFRVSDPDLYPDPDPHGSALIWAVGSESRSAHKLRIRIRIHEGKNDPKNRKKDRIFIFWSAGCSLLRAEGFSCSLGVLYGA